MDLLVSWENLRVSLVQRAGGGGEVEKTIQCVLLCLCSPHAVPFFGFQLGIYLVMSIILLPISFLKQVVSVIQLVVAAKDIAAFDQLKRARAGS